MSGAQMLKNDIQTAADMADIEDVIDQHLTKLQGAENEVAVVKLLNNGLCTVINVFEVLQHSKSQETLFSLVDKMIDIFLIVSEAGKEAKTCAVLALIEKCMDLVISQTVMFIHKIEILKSFNSLLENCPRATKVQLLAESHFRDKLKLVYGAVLDVGDYELQVGIIEFLFRVIPKNMRGDLTKDLMNEEAMCSQFASIQDSRFEADCRHFLNIVNAQNRGSAGRVYSFPANLVKFDGEKLYKPSDEGYDSFWVDFNTGSKRIGLFCEPYFMSSQRSQDGEQLWETVSVWTQDVRKYSCAVEEKSWKIVVEMKPGAQILTNRDPDELSHLLIMTIPKHFDVKKAVDDTFKVHHKASAAENPICIAQESDHHITVSKQRTADQQKNREKDSSQSRSKISVPLEPMITPANSVVSTVSDDLVSWQLIQERQKKQREELTRVSEKISAGGCDRTDEHEFVSTNGSGGNSSKSLKTRSATSTVTSKMPDKEATGQNHIGLESSDIDKQTEPQRVDEKVLGGNDSTPKTASNAEATRGRSQAQVRPSETYTDMRKHNKDARASDACENVAKAHSEQKNVTSSLRRSQREKSTPCRYNIVKIIDNDTTQQNRTAVNSQKKKAVKGSQSQGKLPKHSGKEQLNSGDSSDSTHVLGNEKHQRPNPPDTHHKSKQNDKPSEVSHQELEVMKNIHISSCKQDETKGILDKSLPSNQISGLQDRPPFRNEIPECIPSTAVRESSKQAQNRMIEISETSYTEQAAEECMNDVVQEPTISSFYEERLTKQKKKKNKADKVNKKSLYYGDKFSPGDDFKPSKQFKSGGKSKSKASQRSKANISKDQPQTKSVQKSHTTQGSDLSSTYQSKNKNTDDMTKKTLKDFIPDLPGQREAKMEISKVSSVDTKSVPKTRSWSKEVAKEPPKVLPEAVDKLNDLKKPSGADVQIGETDKKDKVDVSSSGSGELYIEIESPQNEECEVIAETQCVESPPFSPDTSKEWNASEGERQNDCQSKTKLEKHATTSKGSGDFHISSDIPMSANMESSYVFNKQTTVKPNITACCRDKVRATASHLDYQGDFVHNSHHEHGKLQKGEKEMRKEHSDVKQDDKISSFGITSQKCEKRNMANSKSKKTLSKFLSKDSPQVSSSCSAFEAPEGTRKTYDDQKEKVEKGGRQLRERKKVISYKELDSGQTSFVSGVEMNESRKLEKSFRKMSGVVSLSGNKARSNQSNTSIYTSSAWCNVVSATPTEEKNTQTDRDALSRLGSLAPKKLLKGLGSKRHSIYASHSIKKTVEKTVTTMSYTGAIHSSGSSDPYDFEAECKSRSSKPMDILPYRSSSMESHNSVQNTSLGKKSAGKMHFTTERTQKQPHYLKEVREQQKPLEDASYKSTNKDKQISSEYGKTRKKSNKKTFDLKEDKPTSKKNTSKGKRQNPPQSYDKVKSDQEKSDSSNSKSSRLSMFVSQTESEGGLVFPHLDDPIPCTPYEDVNANTCTPNQDANTCTPNQDANANTCSPYQEVYICTPCEDGYICTPCEDCYIYSPDRDSETCPPNEDSKTSQPNKDSKTSPPNEDSKTCPPNQDSETCPPNQDSKTCPPNQDSKTCPPNQDSKTCPPDQVSNTNDTQDVTDKRSTVSSRSDRSWLAKSRTPVEKREKMRGKTYDRMKNAYGVLQDASEYESEEVGPLYSHLHFKKSKEDAMRSGSSQTHKKIVDTADRLPNQATTHLQDTRHKLKTPCRQRLYQFVEKTPKLQKAMETPRKRKMFSPLDFTTTLSVTDANDISEENETAESPKGTTLASILSSSTKKSGTVPKQKVGKNIAFKSPNEDDWAPDEDSDSQDLGEYDKVNAPHSSKVCLRRSTPNIAKMKEGREYSWNLMSSNIENRLQEVIGMSTNMDDESPEVAEPSCVSGPSSTKRCTKSALKRKYPDITSSSCDADSEAGSQQDDTSEEDESSKSRLKPKKLFPDVTPNLLQGKKCTLMHSMKRHQEKSLKSHDASLKSLSKRNSKSITQQDKSDEEDVSTKRKRQSKSQQNLDLSHDERRKTNSKSAWSTSSSYLNFEQSLYTVDSPEKGRSVTQSSSTNRLLEGSLDVSPAIPLTLSSLNSPVIGLSQLNSPPEVDMDDEPCPSPVALLESIKKDLAKFEASHVSEGSSGLSAQMMDIEAENRIDTYSTGARNLREFMMNAKAKSKTSFERDVQSTLTTTCKAVNSLWQTEQDKSSTAIEKFRKVAEKAFSQMNKEMKQLDDDQMKTTLIWTQQMEKLQRHRKNLEKELKRLRETTEEIMSDLENAQAEGQKAKKSLKTAMRQDLETLQRRLFARYNEHSLEAMKRCLQASIM